MLGTIVAAGGAGARFGGEKILAPLGGVPVLLRTLDRLARIRDVREMVLVLPPARIGEIGRTLGGELSARGVTRIVPGGETRQASVANGLAALPPEADLVLVHDAVRPLFSLRAAEEVVDRAREAGAAILAVPARDTLKRVAEEKGEPVARETVPREGIWLAETPQVFRGDLLRAALRLAPRSDSGATDEAALVERLGHPVRVVRGPPGNVKITEPRDLEILEALLEREVGR